MNLILKLFQLCLLLTVITLPFHRSIGGLVWGGLVLTWLIYFRFKTSIVKQIVSNPMAVLLMAFLLLYVIGLIYANDFGYGIKVLERKTTFLIFPIVMSGLIYLPKKFSERILWYFIYGMAASSILCLLIAFYRTISSGSINFINPENLIVENNFLYHRLSSAIDIHAVYYSMFIAFALILVINHLLENYKLLHYKRIILNIVLVLILGTMIFLLKAGIIAIGFFVAFLIVVTNHILKREYLSLRSKVFYFVLIFSATFFASIIVIKKVGPQEEYFSYDMKIVPPDQGWNSINLRLAKWDVAIQAIKDHWITGVGTGDLKSTLDEYYLGNGFEFAYLEHFNTHNQFLQTFLTIGILGFLVLISLFIFGIYTSLKNRDLVLFIFLILFGLFSISESTLATNKGIVAFSFFMSFLSYRTKSNSF